MQTLLRCENIAVGFDGKAVVENVNFELCEGDLLCIVGENGTGKTTLMNAVLGLVPLMNGTIQMCELKKGEIGYLPQRINKHQSFPASVKEVVLSGFVGKSFLFPFYTKDQKCRADDSMRMLQIERIKNKPFVELSGGLQQRTLLARAFCAAKKLVIFDEPVASLDPIATADFYKLLSHLNKDHGLSVMMVSHDIEEAVKYSNKILHLNHSKSFFGSTDDYVNSEIYRRFIEAKKEDKEDD